MDYDFTSYETEVRAAHAAALTAYHDACRRLREATWKLPTLPSTMSGEFVEVGYERSEQIEADEPGPHTICSRGWSAISDEGQAEWIEADGQCWKVPEDVDWT